MTAARKHDLDGNLNEHALAMSEERFRNLVDKSRDALALVDTAGNISWMSTAITHILGWEPEDLVGTSAFSLVHPEDLVDGLVRAATAFELGTPQDPMTLRLAKPTGEFAPVEIAVASLRDSVGQVESAVVSLRDVSWRVHAEEALLRSERRFRALVQHSIDAVLVIDAAASIQYASPAIEHVWGRPTADLVGSSGTEYIHPNDREGLMASLAHVFVTPGSSGRTEARGLDADGRWRWLEIEATNLLADDAVNGIVIHVRDVTERREAERDNKRLIDIFEATNDLVGISDRQGEPVYLNASARRFFGLGERGPIEGFNLGECFPPSVLELFSSEIRPRLEREGMWSGELSVARFDGELVPVLGQLLVHRDSEHNRVLISGVLHDIRKRKEFESALAHQATHDPLTGLPNRSLLLDRLDVALARAKRHRLRVAVLFLDLDHFKVVNDSLGHDLGDRLLEMIAQRLLTALRPGDTVARFGGDEFVVLCQDMHTRSDAFAIADRVIASVSGPFVVDEAEVFIGASVGVAFPDDPDADPGTLIRDADAAMYRAKERGRGRWEIFDNELRVSAVDRLDIENALRRALDRRELRVYFQPIVDLERGGIGAVEALLRWEHGERGLLLPGEFINVAEETGLIVPIGMWVLDQACRQVQRWQASIPDLSGLVVSVNLSGRQLGHPRLVEDVRAVLSDTGLAPERLELEITESVLMDDVAMSAEMLGRLNALGVRIAVDDFGTGYSSMSYLRRFPVDVLKVDREFVNGLGTDASDSAIVTAIITLAHALGLSAVAEGVETTAQLDELRSLGCDKAQGFLIARPASGDDISELLSMPPVW